MKYCYLLLISLCAAFSCTSKAEVFEFVGQIGTFRTHNSEQFPNNDWIRVPGFIAAGACPTYEGKVLMMLNTAGSDNGDRMFSNLLMAKGTGATVRVSVDDGVKAASGYCYLRTLQIEG